MNGRDEIVGIVGLGYVGLPLAVSFGESKGKEIADGQVLRLGAGWGPQMAGSRA